MLRALKGKDMTTKEIWKNYRSRLKAFLHSKVSNPADVEDLLQEVLLKTLASGSQLKDPSKLQAWLFQTTQTTIIDHYRKGGRARNVSAEDLWYVQDAPVALAGLEDCVEPFLEALPGETADMLRAIDIEGQSQKAYAETQGISYSTLKSRVQQGRSDLRAIFESCCHMSRDHLGNINDFRIKSDVCKKC
jgi:RNA polymerase sigma-70 factor (ECF subfamily)